MYLVNAIYFNATWKYQFDPEDTFEGDFHLEGGGQAQTDFMQVEGGFNYTIHEDFTAVELPYGDSTFSMVVLLPKPGSPSMHWWGPWMRRAGIPGFPHPTPPMC
jgi:serpin B